MARRFDLGAFGRVLGKFNPLRLLDGAARSRLLTRWTIRTRTILLALTAIFGLAAVAGEYWLNDQRVADAFDEANAYGELARDAREMSLSVLEMRRIERDFMITRDDLLTYDYEGPAANIEGKLQLMRANAVAKPLLQQVDGATAALEQHRVAFADMVNAQRALGLSLDSGLQGKMQKSADTVATALAATKSANPFAVFDAVIINFNAMRLSEKNYMGSGDAAEADAFRKAATEAAKRMDYTGIPAEKRQPLKDALSEYVADFDAWVAARDQLAVLTKKLDTLFAQLQGELNEIKLQADLHSSVKANELREVRKAGREAVYLGMGAVAGLVLLVCLLVGRSITLPLDRLTVGMRQLAQGDTSLEIADATIKNEIGEMARALLIFKENAIEREQLTAEQERQRANTQTRAEEVAKSISDFEQRVQAALGAVANAVQELEDVSSALATNAQRVTERASLAGQAAASSSQDVEAAAGAAAQLAASIEEISGQAVKSTDVAKRAVSEARKTNSTMRGLAEAADRIGEVVTLIQDIAEQTNLLALNATIEAARAGAMGKGFAVVAAEVKALAGQTAKATDEISQQIGEIQNSATAAAEAISLVDSIIEEMSSIAATVSAAVEEQNAAVGNIAENVNRAASGARDGADNITEVHRAADETGSTAEHMKMLAATLSEQAESLRSDVDNFLHRVRAA